MSVDRKRLLKEFKRSGNNDAFIQAMIRVVFENYSDIPAEAIEGMDDDVIFLERLPDHFIGMMMAEVVTFRESEAQSRREKFHRECKIK